MLLCCGSQALTANVPQYAGCSLQSCGSVACVPGASLLASPNSRGRHNLNFLAADLMWRSSFESFPSSLLTNLYFYNLIIRLLSPVMQPSLRPLQRLLLGSALRLSSPASAQRARFSTAALSQHSQPRPSLRFLRPAPFSQFLVRYNSELTAPASTNPNATAPNRAARPDTPAYQLTFTCKPCKHRSAHRISKLGYHRGTVLIQCPSCKNRHVVSDHLKIFMDEASTLEDILQKQGTMIKKGKLGLRQGKVVGNEGEEDIEFWDDGSETTHKGAEG